MTTIWTHRGDGIENSLAAFQSAWNKNVRHFETDIHLTRDGQLVLSHDPNIFRLTGIRKDIHEIDFNELQQFPISGLEPWALVDELVHSFPTATISIDVKTSNALPAMIDWLNQQKNRSRFVVGSFNSKRILRIRDEFKDITTALTANELLKLKMGNRDSVAKLNRSIFAMLPLRFYNLKVLTDRLQETLLRQQIPIHIWTLNSVDDFQAVKNLNIDGVVTDDIDLASKFFTNT